MAEKLIDSQGREYQVQDLIKQCGREYRSTQLKKKPRLAHHNWTPAEMQWIVQNTIEAVQCRWGLGYKQAQSLQWRCRTRMAELGLISTP